MSNSPVYLASLQSADSASNIFRPSVEVPREIKINVARPTIKSLDTVTIDTPKQAEPATSAVSIQAQEVQSQEDLNVQSHPQGPDTLDHVLLKPWQESGYEKELWTSVSNDSVSRLPVNYFKRTYVEQYQQEASPDAQSSAQTFFTDTPTIHEYSVVRGHQAVSRIEEIQIADESILTPKSYDEPLRSQDWFLVVIIALVALTGLIRLKWQKYLNSIFSAVVFFNVANKLQTTPTSSTKLASFWLGFLFYANFSLLLFETMRISNRTFFDLTGWKLLLSLMAFLFVIFSLKLLVYQFVGWVFKVQKATSEYLFQSATMSKAYGVILMPLVVLFPFLEAEAQNWIPKIGLTIFILLYVIQIGRGMSANLRDTLSGYYIILYLCALEILPLSILYKILFY